MHLAFPPFVFENAKLYQFYRYCGLRSCQLSLHICFSTDIAIKIGYLNDSTTSCVSFLL